jgi:hypothetical protein
MVVMKKWLLLMSAVLIMVNVHAQKLNPTKWSFEAVKKAGDAKKQVVGSLFGDDEDTIYHTLVNCGYNVRYKVLNAKNLKSRKGKKRKK